MACVVMYPHLIGDQRWADKDSDKQVPCFPQIDSDLTGRSLAAGDADLQTTFRLG
jgi:hypothetical protein